MIFCCTGKVNYMKYLANMEKKKDYLKKLELSRQLEGRVVFNVLLDRNFAVETEEKTYILLQENFPTRKISLPGNFQVYQSAY